MSGRELVNILEGELKKRGIQKKDFCQAIGVSAATYSHWANGTIPRQDRIKAIEEYLGIDLSNFESEEEINENNQLRSALRDRQDLRILLNSAKDVPPSSVYALISQLEKMKEDSV